ncbi:hypothetical protein LTR78_002254 [Recurvomyces mirabilis]|uniref:Uncharacterized protein n=1 Tax=Recurvomyces mirabilis TaxID=574656 RepID=A0AAE0WU94_9PEZI|nr:hypothetical protein LTR78_002254 [Recurvomyces mirabilis]KAK5160709.1 hypothetical protein LTS14_001722 [Recurvomyces mirabilis]
MPPAVMPPFTNSTNLTEVILAVLKNKMYNLTIILNAGDDAGAPLGSSGTGLAGDFAELLTKVILGGLEDTVLLDKILIYGVRAFGVGFVGHKAWRRLRVGQRDAIVTNLIMVKNVVATEVGKAMRLMQKHVGLDVDLGNATNDAQSAPFVDIEMGVGFDSTSTSTQRQGFYLQGGNPRIQGEVGVDGLVDITAQVLGADDTGPAGSPVDLVQEAGDLGLLASCFQGEV